LELSPTDPFPTTGMLAKSAVYPFFEPGFACLVFFSYWPLCTPFLGRPAPTRSWHIFGTVIMSPLITCSRWCFEEPSGRSTHITPYKFPTFPSFSYSRLSPMASEGCYYSGIPLKPQCESEREGLIMTLIPLQAEFSFPTPPDPIFFIVPPHMSMACCTVIVPAK